MKAIVPSGYAVSQAERQRLIEKLRQARAQELAKASDKERARIEREISEEEAGGFTSRKRRFPFLHEEDMLIW